MDIPLYQRHFLAENKEVTDNINRLLEEAREGTGFGTRKDFERAEQNIKKELSVATDFAEAQGTTVRSFHVNLVNYRLSRNEVAKASEAVKTHLKNKTFSEVCGAKINQVRALEKYRESLPDHRKGIWSRLNPRKGMRKTIATL